MASGCGICDNLSNLRLKADFEPQIRADSEDFADWLQAAESVII
ncbi:Uncharacterized protein dnm_066720 [Desulfonema magnum]|uniref:Uncharacterized protein n=1 Tax=Desulfonema magnum TaxID=45655 RepID=A0A975GR24_9BACT|nr:Uncharacterized protein dnm_066680 [Desulfonema magnum]QTA90609.1 Uncharacterized protein dnm_066700 [Desulfonema magnum]QTA90611.1 Uncharacterized protein dnm_066720 [Desulfonema magnum]